MLIESIIFQICDRSQTIVKCVKEFTSVGGAKRKIDKQENVPTVAIGPCTVRATAFVRGSFVVFITHSI
jgi:hypothetical protein